MNTPKYYTANWDCGALWSQHYLLNNRSHGIESRWRQNGIRNEVFTWKQSRLIGAVVKFNY